MVDQVSPIDSINPYKLLGIVHSLDDSITRVIDIPCTTATNEASKDVSLNPSTKTWIRIFKPTEPPPAQDIKLPVVIYFRGGAFVFCSAANTIFHNLCTSMANKFPAVIVSVEYRLAPESRLPAAYEDSIDAINWVRKQALDANGEPWLKDLCDFSKCFLMGCSSGGNIVYHTGLRAATLDLKPLVITGYILNQPFFGGCQRTESELQPVTDKNLPLSATDLVWDLALPKGCDRDHEYSNPMVGSGDKRFGLMVGRWFVSVRGRDPLRDRQLVFVKMLEGKGVDVVSWFDKDGYHGLELFEPDKAQPLLQTIQWNVNRIVRQEGWLVDALEPWRVIDMDYWVNDKVSMVLVKPSR